MDLILAAATVLLVSVTVLLWRLGTVRTVDLSLETSLAPDQDFTVSATPKLSIRPSVWLRTAVYWLFSGLLRMLERYPHVTLIGLVVCITGSIYLFIRGYNAWAVLTAIILTLLLLNLITAWRRKVVMLMLKRTGIEYAGKLTLPSKVYEGDSHTISINLQQCPEVVPNLGRPIRIQDTKGGKSIVVQFEPDSGLEQFLEFELLAAGLTVDGEKKQRQPLTSRTILAVKTLSFRWNCYFPNSGNHRISLILRLVGSSGTIELGAIEHTMKVVKLDHLTQRQVWLLASLAGMVSTGLAIAEVLHQLAIW